MALHLYNGVIKFNDIQDYMSEMPSMSWYSDDIIPGNVLNINLNVSIDTKLSTCETHMSNIQHFSCMFRIVRA